MIIKMGLKASDLKIINEGFKPWGLFRRLQLQMGVSEIRVPYFGFFITRILLFRVQY